MTAIDELPIFISNDTKLRIVYTDRYDHKFLVDIDILLQETGLVLLVDNKHITLESDKINEKKNEVVEITFKQLIKALFKKVCDYGQD